MSEIILGYTTGVDKLSIRRRKKLIGRMMRKIIRSSKIANEYVTDLCWLWTGFCGEDGYGIIRVHGLNSMRLVSRVTYELFNGPLGQLRALHKCDRPNCCNPKHLFSGTQKENCADMVRKGRSAKGEKHRTKTHPDTINRGWDQGNVTYTQADIDKIYELFDRGMNAREISRFVTISENTIRRIIKGKHFASRKSKDASV